MAFCRNCGHQIDATAPICLRCNAAQFNVSSTAKNKVAAGVLALLLGTLGGHKFYTGAWGWGIVYIALSMTSVPLFISIIEGIRYLTMADAEFEYKAAQMDGPFAFLW